MVNGRRARINDHDGVIMNAMLAMSIVIARRITGTQARYFLMQFQLLLYSVYDFIECGTVVSFEVHLWSQASISGQLRPLQRASLGRS